MSKDLIDKIFGRLKVIAKAGLDKHRNQIWKCICECGNTKEIIANNLNRGKSLSCGCLQIERSRRNLKPGNIFGRLSVIEFEGVSKHRSMYRCKCECGKETVVQAHRLLQGITISCGCARQTHGLSRTREYQKLHSRLRRARKMNAEGSHTSEDIRALFDEQRGLCYYCNIELPTYHIEHKIPLCRGGSDYKENICLACPPCNLRKHTRTDLEFLQLTHE